MNVKNTCQENLKTQISYLCSPCKYLHYFHIIYIGVKQKTHII
jgi:hypothetical protein